MGGSLKIHSTVQQGSLAWLELRAGKVTASEIGEMLTPQFKPRTGDRPQKYLYTKLAEHVLRGPLPDSGRSFAMEQGSIREEEARPWLEMETGLEVQTVGFIETDDGRAGCSPDGLIGEYGGAEIKCPQPATHVRYLIEGILPEQYITQVHASLYVTGRKWWYFLSYCPGFSPLLLTVERNEVACDAIASALEHFKTRFNTALEKL